jgi:hypothetical protein
MAVVEVENREETIRRCMAWFSVCLSDAFKESLNVSGQ